VDPDTETLETELNDIERLNEQAREVQAHKDSKEEVGKHQKGADALTEHLGEFADQISCLLSDAKLPVRGLSIHADGTVYYKDLPFEQASSAEELEISLAMGAAMHPKLKFLALKEASMMTETTRARVEKWAAKYGYFVLMELATADKIGIHIEDGEVVTQ